MPRTTLNRNIKELVDRELIKQEQAEISTGGRPPTLLSPNPNGLYTIGIELSRSRIRLVICNANIEPIWTYDYPMVKGSNAKRVLPSIFEILKESIDKFIPSKSRIIGIGVGAVGPMDLEEGRILDVSSFPTQSWSNLDIKTMLYEEFHIPVYIANGASTAAMGEYARRGGVDRYSLVYINVGIGLRCGVIWDGILQNGEKDREGAFAHVVIEPGGRPCYCGSYGCVESYVTALAIVEDFKYEMRKGRDNIYRDRKNPSSIEFRDIYVAARKGDILAREVMDRASNYMGIFMANVINMLHPQVVVVGGMVPDMYPDYFGNAVNIAKGFIYGSSELNPIFSTSLLGDNTIAIGAAALVMLSYLEGDSLKEARVYDGREK